MIKSKRKVNKALLIANAPGWWLNANWFMHLVGAHGAETAVAMGLDASESVTFVGHSKNCVHVDVSGVVVWRDTSYEDKWWGALLYK